MSTEQLIIELDARTAKLDAKLNKVERNLDGVENKTKKADRAFAKFSSGFNKMDINLKSILTGSATAILALSAAVTAMTLSSAKNRRELELLAGQAKTSTSDFQALSFATSKYGIDAEKIADISKDIADKIGEFSAAGTGAFQDYADVMKLSKDQAREAAQEFEGLSSQEILGKMVSRMEDASVSGDKMTFVLESLGSDASRLIPLFKGNSSELKELKKRFNDVNDSLQITGKQADALRDVSNTFTLMTSSIGNATTAISATLAPAFDDFFNSVIRVVPSATKAIIDFTNSFLDPEDINSVAGVLKQLEDSEERLSNKLRRSENDKLNTNLKEAVEAEEKRIEGLKAQLLILKEHEKNIAEVGKRAIEDRFKSEEILLSEKLQRDLKEVGDDYELQKKLAEKFAEDLKNIRSRKVDREIDRGTGTGEEIQAIADRFKAEEVLLAEKLNRELLMVGDNDKLKKELAEKFAEDLKNIRVESEEKFKDETQTKDEAEIEALVEKQARLEEYLQNKLISEQEYQEKLKEIIGEYAPETLDPSILEEKNQTELDLLNDKLEQQLISYESYFRSLKKLQDKDGKDKNKNDEKVASAEEALKRKGAQSIMQIGAALVESDSKMSKALFLGSQALAASDVIVNTEAAAIKSLTIDPLGALATKIHIQGALSLAAIAATTFGSKSSSNSGGGGSITVGGSSSSQIAQPQNIEEETSNLEFTEQTEGGITTQRLVLSLENGQDLFDGIIEGTEQRRRTGR